MLNTAPAFSIEPREQIERTTVAHIAEKLDDEAIGPIAFASIRRRDPSASEPEWRGCIERTSNERYTKQRCGIEAEIERFLLGARELE